MKIKVGDTVKISSGTGKVVWMKPRKIAKDGNPNLPLIDGPDWDIGVMIRNPPGCLFPFFTYCAHAEFATIVKNK